MNDDKPDEQPKIMAEPEIVSTFATRKSRKKQPPYAPMLIGGVAVAIVGAAAFFVLRDAKAEVGSVIVEGDGVNCRAGPGLTDPSLTKFDRGTSLKVLKIEGGWYQVEHSPEPCWITATLVSFTPAENEASEENTPDAPDTNGVSDSIGQIDPMTDGEIVSDIAQTSTLQDSIAAPPVNVCVEAQSYSLSITRVWHNGQRWKLTYYRSSPNVTTTIDISTNSSRLIIGSDAIDLYWYNC